MGKLSGKNYDILKRIIRLAIPATISQVISIVYSIVDRIFIGKMALDSTDALSGVGACFPVLILITAIGQLLAVGGSTVISIYLGNNDRKSAEKVMGNVGSLIGIGAIILLCILEYWKTPILLCFGASKNTVVYANKYLTIYLLGIFFQLFIQVFSSLLICQGFAKESMEICAVSAAANVGLDFIFIIILKMGVEGAAIATVIAQILGALMQIFFIIETDEGREKLRFRRQYFKLQRSIVGNIFMCGIAAFTMSFTEACIHAVYNMSLQAYGSDVYVAAMTIIQSLMQFIYVFSNGLTQATQPTISYYYGANDNNGVRIAYKAGMIMHMVIAIGGSSILILTREFTAGIFTSDLMVMNAVVSSLPIYLAGWCIFGIQSGVQCIFVGLGKAKYSMVLALFRKVFLLIPLMLFLPRIWGVNGIFLAEAISDGLAGITAGVLFVCVRKKLMDRRIVTKAL